MKRFKTFLIEEYEFALLLEGKGQKQLIKQFGPKILELMQRDYGRLGASGDMPGTAHYAKFSSEPGHGTTEHMHDYIMKHMQIPETPSYLNIQKPDDANTWNQHLNWMLSRYAQGDQSNNSGIQRLEDIRHRALPALARYHGLVQQGKMDKSSLAKWKNLTDMENALQNADPLEAGKLKNSEYHVHDENEHWSLVTPHTSEAACTLGHGTKWCTTSGAFEEYIEQGPLYIMIPKKPQHKNEKYQLHVESGQFMDKEDDPAEMGDLDVKNRPVTPKMSALLKLHRKDRSTDFSPEEQDWLIDNHPHVAVEHNMEARLTKPQTLKLISLTSPLNQDDKTRLVRTSKHIDSEAITHILNNSFKDSDSMDSGPSYHSEIATTMLRQQHLAPFFTREHFETIANSNNDRAKTVLASHENLPHDILQQLKQGPSGDVRMSAMANKNTTTDEIVDYLSKPHVNFGTHLHKLISHPNLPKDVFDDVFDYAADPLTHTPRTEIGARLAKAHPSPKNADELGSNRKNGITDDNWRQIAAHDTFRGSILTEALKSPHLDTRQLDKMVDIHTSGANMRHDFSDGILYSPKATEEHYLRMIEDAPQSRTTDIPMKAINTFSVVDGAGEKMTPRILDALTTHENLDYAGAFEKIIQHPLFGESQRAILRGRLAARTRPHPYAKDYESLMNGEE